MQESRTLVDCTCDICGNTITIENEYKELKKEPNVIGGTLVPSPSKWYLIAGLDICGEHSDLMIKDLDKLIEKASLRS